MFFVPLSDFENVRKGTVECVLVIFIIKIYLRLDR